MSENEWAEKLAEKVEPDWRAEFVRFVTTGESSSEFRSHLESCQTCQAATEQAIQAVSRGFEALGEALAADRKK